MDDRPDEVVREELDALDDVTRKLAALPPAKTASEAPIVKELERIRERLLSGDENKDLSALTEQYHNQSAILNQLRRAGQARGAEAHQQAAENEERAARRREARLAEIAGDAA